VLHSIFGSQINAGIWRQSALSFSEFSVASVSSFAAYKKYGHYASEQSSSVRLLTKMDPKQLGTSRLAQERRLRIFERRMEQEFKEQYQYYMRNSKVLDHRDQVNSQEGRKMLLSNNCPVFKEISPMTTVWLLRNPTINNFQVKNDTTQVQTTNSTASTNRKMPATTALIIDPHRLLSPAVIAYEIFLQKLWQDKLERDELLPGHQQQEWNQPLQLLLNCHNSR